MTQPYQDATLTPAERAADLVGRLTVAEKAGQLTQYFYLGVPGGLPDDFDIDSLPPEHARYVRQPQMVEEALERGGAGSLLFVTDPAEINRLQRKAIAGNRLGIPLLFGFDVIHGFRTVFPVPIGLAASWCPETIEAAQAVAAREARAVGIGWAFAPMVDIARDPRWGRIIEGAGEDPHLGGAVAAAQVRGFQGPALGTPERIIAGPKHFAGYGAALGGRDYDDADISDSELWNVYLPPFRAAVEAGAGNVMSAYMDLNGVPASGNRWLLTDVLRDEFGFDGFVVSDANAVRSLVTQHFARDLTDAGARALAAGLDMEMLMTDAAFDRLPDAIAQGLVSEAQLDEAVRRVLTAKFAMGVFENPFVDEDAAPVVLATQAHRDEARRAAERSAVLLRNDGVLPLAADAVMSVAVIGALADSARDTLGPWVFNHDLAETVTTLAGIEAAAGDGVRVAYAAGVKPATRVYPSMFDRMDNLPPFDPTFDDDAGIAEAAALAAASDVAIVVLGQPQNMIGENASTSTLDLPGRQLDLLKAVVATGTPVVAVVMSGRPVDLRWADANVAAILQVWYPGTQGGAAVGNLLFGHAVPGGRLPFTWPRTVGQVPMVYNHYRTFAPQDQGKRYWDEESTPLYPFGYGLSYATFEYSGLRLAADAVGVGEAVTVSVDVTNTGARTADEVVQLYVHQRHGEASRPVRELKGFARITLDARETRTVTLTLGADALRYWSAASRTWVQDATTVDVWVGGDSRAELTTVLTVG